MSKWFSVKNVLPLWPGPYLVTCEDGVVCEALFDPEIRSWFGKTVGIFRVDPESRTWFNETAGLLKVTYWMPMPKPPKGDKA